MSDESTPSPTPSLRLKPRLRPDVSATPPPAIPKIAIAQTLDADGVLAVGERKVFSAPAPEPTAENTPPAPDVEESPKKTALTPKLTVDAKSKRFSLPVATSTGGLKRLPPSITPTPGSGEDGAPQDEDDAHLGPTSYAKGDHASAQTAEDPASSKATGDAATAYAAEHPLSDEESDSSQRSVGSPAEDDAGESDATSAADADAIEDPGHSGDGEAMGAPHPEVDVPTRFSPPANETSEGARFKLKPRLSAPENPPMHGGVSLPPAIPGSNHAAPPPGIKIVPTAPVGPSSGSLPVKVPLQPRAAANGTRQVRRVVVKSGRPLLKYFLITFGVLAGIGMAVGGFLGFRYLAQLEKHPAIEQPTLVVPIKKLNLPTKTTAPKSAAGRLVDQAKAAANAQAEEIDSITEGAPKPLTQGSAAKPAATTTAASTAPVTSLTSPGPATTTATAATVAKPAAPEPPKVVPPSAEFRALIVNMRVSGVFQGAHPRALLNGRLLNAGEMLDQTLQIRFMGIDAPHKQLLFEDGAGSSMQRHY